MTSENKKILILYYSSSTVCGIGTWIEMLSEVLNKKGWDVTVGLAWGKVYHNPENIERARPELKTVWMDGRTGTEEGRIQAVERTIRKIKPAIVILTCLNSPFTAIRKLRNDGMNFRLIVVNHGNIPKQAACLIENRDVIDMAVCISRFSYNIMSVISDGFDKERICHISHAVPKALAIKNSWNDKPYRIGYAGRLDADKRAEDIIPFFKDLICNYPLSEIWIAGKGEYENDIQKLMDDFPKQVKYFGRMTRKQLYESFYPFLDILIHFSPSEAWGLSIAEAMAHGVVPIVSEFRGIYFDHLVKNNENGFIFPVADYKRAVELVSNLFNKPDKLEKLGRQAIKYIENSFTVEQFSNKWSEALNQCLDLESLPIPAVNKPLKERRFFLNERNREYIRRLLRLRIPHQSPGEEWSHFRCNDKNLFQMVNIAFQSAEADKKGESI